MMSTHEKRLTEFANGRKLTRLSQPIRDRADTPCDACGSLQPRYLYALKDLEADRYYFVGQNCLKMLAKQGVILRNFGKESGNSAYQTEMERRHEQGEGPKNGIDSPEQTLSQHDQKPPTSLELAPCHSSVAFVIEGPEWYEAWVSVLSADGAPIAWGHATEIRFEEVWRGRRVDGFLLEKFKQERCSALELCLTKAWESVDSLVARSESVPPQRLGVDGAAPKESHAALTNEAMKIVGMPTAVNSPFHLYNLISSTLAHSELRRKQGKEN